MIKTKKKSKYVSRVNLDKITNKLPMRIRAHVMMHLSPKVKYYANREPNEEQGKTVDSPVQ